jgi:membrane-associated phospholipid phosphatase
MRKYLFNIGVVFVLLLPLMILGSFYDLEITYKLSQIRYETGNYIYTPQAWVVPVEIISEIPAMILFAISSTLAYNYIKKCLENDIKMKCLRCLMIAISMFSIFRLGQTVTMGITNNYDLSILWYVGIGIITILISHLLYICLKKVEEDKLKSIIDVVVITICAGIVIFGVMGIIKYSWGRPRLRNLINEGNLQGYLPWYKPMFFSGYASFPSGHSAKAGYMFILTIWFDRNIKLKKMLYVITWIYVVMACGARLMQAEHYLTDVVFGTFITYALVEFFKYVYYSEWMKKNVNAP